MSGDWPAVGDQVLVDTGCYGVQGYHWCPVIRLAPGSAAVYPVKVEVPGRGEGQYAPTEILDHRAAPETGP
jgi:hypothetical protein